MAALVGELQRLQGEAVEAERRVVGAKAAVRAAAERYTAAVADVEDATLAKSSLCDQLLATMQSNEVRGGKAIVSYCILVHITSIPRNVQPLCCHFLRTRNIRKCSQLQVP